MSFEPNADFTKDVSFPNRNNHVQSRQNAFRSPLLQSPGVTQFQPNSQNKPSYNQSNYNGTVYGRLGQRNPYKNIHNSDNSNNNNRNDDNRNFNRKRIGDTNFGPKMTKRNWRNNNNRQPYYQNSTNTAQNRINRIRNSYQQVDQGPPSQTNELNSGQELNNFNDSQELDATDIVVEVINHQAPPSEETSLAPFKMVLDPKTQAAIKVIQAKRKEKQVIFPYAVTPNVTEISLHDRFTML